jgi:excisionase family DNA binding protein
LEPDSNQQYLRPGTAAEILHVSPKTVNRWAKEGRIPCIVTLGGHQRFLREDVMAVAAKMASPSSAAEQPAKGARQDASPAQGR